MIEHLDIAGNEIKIGDLLYTTRTKRRAELHRAHVVDFTTQMIKVRYVSDGAIAFKRQKMLIKFMGNEEVARMSNTTMYQFLAQKVLNVCGEKYFVLLTPGGGEILSETKETLLTFTFLFEYVDFMMERLEAVKND